MKPDLGSIRDQATIHGRALHINNAEFITVPLDDEERSTIQVVGTENGNILNHIFIGTGTGGDGLILNYTCRSNDAYQLQQIYNPGINAMDLLPADNHDKDTWVNDVIVTGAGYTDSGVRRVSLYQPSQTHIIAPATFNAYEDSLKRDHNEMYTPRLSASEADRKLYLDMHATTSSAIADKPRARKDITDKLHANGIDIERTLQRIINYERTHTH